MSEGVPGDRDPWPVALRILARQDRSTQDLRERLLGRGFARERVEQVLERCRELGYLDDQRFAEQTVRMLLGSGRAFGRRLEQELKKKGIDSTTAQRAMAAADPELDIHHLIRDLAARRYPGFDIRKADPREKRRVVHFFLRRGFPTGDILSALHAEED